MVNASELGKSAMQKAAAQGSHSYVGKIENISSGGIMMFTSSQRR